MLYMTDNQLYQIRENMFNYIKEKLDNIQLSQYEIKFYNEYMNITYNYIYNLKYNTENNKYYFKKYGSSDVDCTSNFNKFIRKQKLEKINIKNEKTTIS